MSREKQIEEMAKALMKAINENPGHISMRALAEALYNAGYRKQEWISVDERLPEDDDCTVLYYDGEEVDACDFYFGTFNTMDTYESSEIYGVTHWMPLPEAPKMKGGVTAESAIRAVQEAALELENTPPDNLLCIGSTMQF